MGRLKLPEALVRSRDSERSRAYNAIYSSCPRDGGSEPDWLLRTPLPRATLEGASADLVVFTAADIHAWPSRSAPRVVLRQGQSIAP